MLAIAESKMSSSSLTKDQFVLVVACPLIVLLFVVDILILLSVVVYTYVSTLSFWFFHAYSIICTHLFTFSCAEEEETKQD